MRLKEFNITLDIKKPSNSEYIEVVQCDNETSVFNIQLKNNNKAYNLEGVATEIVFLKSNGEIEVKDISVLDSGEGKLKYVLNGEDLNVPGIMKSEIRIKQEGKLLTAAQFNFYVRRVIRCS